MKRFSALSLIIFIAIGLLSACQTDSGTKEPDISVTGYPAGDESIHVDTVESDASLAYPIPEEDLALLTGSWVLSSRIENNTLQKVTEKRLTLNEDGSYEIVTPDGSSSGVWIANANMIEAVLVFDLGTSRSIAYSITELNADSLQIRFQQEGDEIVEEYLSVD